MLSDDAELQRERDAMPQGQADEETSWLLWSRYDWCRHQHQPLTFRHQTVGTIWPPEVSRKMGDAGYPEGTTQTAAPLRTRQAVRQGVPHVSKPTFEATVSVGLAAQPFADGGSGRQQRRTGPCDAAQVDADSQLIIELGAGTGAVTTALLARGIVPRPWS